MHQECPNQPVSKLPVKMLGKARADRIDRSARALLILPLGKELLETLRLRKRQSRRTIEDGLARYPEKQIAHPGSWCSSIHHFASCSGNGAVQGRHRRLLSALNARPEAQLDEWLAEITEGLAAYDKAHPDRPSAPFAVNQIVHRSNKRLEHDLGLCVKYKVPIVISSLGAVPEVNAAIHSYGGIVLHDVINNRHANSAIRKGADGLIAVAAGAGGHAGALSPFALVQEIRSGSTAPASFRRHRQRRLDPRRTGHGCRPRLYRLTLHRHDRSTRDRCL